MAGTEITLRPATETEIADPSFFAASRTDFDALPSPIREQMIADQARIQIAGYRTTYPDLAVEIIVDGDETLGRVLTAVDEPSAAIVIVDVVVLALARGRGVAGTVYEALKARARETDRGLRASVIEGNDASHQLHRTAGFVAAAVGDDGRTSYAWSHKNEDPTG